MLNLAPSDAELVDVARERLFALEDPLTEIRDYARALMFISFSDHIGGPELSSVLSRLATNLMGGHELIEEERMELLQALNARRHAHQHDDHGDDGNGEVEPAVGEAG